MTGITRIIRKFDIQIIKNKNKFENLNELLILYSYESSFNITVKYILY